ncbi:hypothetical protein D5H75_17270 [Bailinhaonella thermotolerans]|uniref:Uncharacterized protein n=1 Tax=Bailinhaonella thermotolerans TaxID=1070861 RepID=A0A3A4ASG2_9ACTN|nr:hypothetical protein D5H75_17270 [Bailinhaonella thermotolerans]
MIAAVVVQALTVVPFLIGILVVLLYGGRAQSAAEREMRRQGLSATALTRNGVDFGGSEGLAVLIVLLLVAAALLVLAGKRAGRLLSWVLHPVLFVLGIVIVPVQLFTARFLASSFADAGDPELARVDVPALVAAAAQAMPAWLPAVNAAKLVLTTLGSLAVVVLLALPSARAHFRKPPAAA